MPSLHEQFTPVPAACPVALASSAPSLKLAGLTMESAIPQLVAQVFETAPPDFRRHLLEQLLRPLGVLALVAVANGIFAKIWFRSGLTDLQVHLEDAQHVQASDVIALVDRVQQISLKSVDGLLQVLTTSPMLTGSAAALLATILMHRTQNGQADD